jgi:glutamyl-tRNA reductase
MKLFVAGLSYKTAPVEVRERLAVAPARLRCSGCRLKVAGALNELVLLSTCNRVEVYGTTPRLNGNVDALFRQLSPACAGRPAADARPFLYVKEGAEAVKHLFAVASGLDSMVLGETEITGQVKQAYQAAHEAKLTGRVMNRVFQAALQTAKEIRTRTLIGRGATSVGSVAVELAEKVFGHDLTQQTVMIIGAGKMGETCVRHLAKRRPRAILVCNRSPERAAALAGAFDGRAVPYEDCLRAMVEADIVVSSTGSPDVILRPDDVAGVLRPRRHRPLVLIDIAVPRDIHPDVQRLAGAYLYDIDDLEAIVRENLRHREEELARCHAIIAEHTAEVLAKLTPPNPTSTHEPGVQSQPGWLLWGAAPCRG